MLHTTKFMYIIELYLYTIVFDFEQTIRYDDIHDTNKLQNHHMDSKGHAYNNYNSAILYLLLIGCF